MKKALKVIIACVIGLLVGLAIASAFPSTYVWIKVPQLKIISLKFWLVAFGLVCIFSLFWLCIRKGCLWASGFSAGLICGYSAIFTVP